MSDKLQGPWKIRYEGERYYVPVDVDSKFDEIKAERDELLEALEFLVAAASGEGPPVPERELLQDCVDKARAALAKAKGE